MIAEDGTLSEIVVQGDDQQVDQMRKELQLSEKGMVYVKGLFERWWNIFNNTEDMVYSQGMHKVVWQCMF